MFWFIPVILGSVIAGGTIGCLVGIVIPWIIDEFTVENTVREKVYAEPRFDDAIIAVVNSKTTRNVKIGVYAEDDNHLGDIELESDKGVAADVKVGHVFYLTN